MRRQRKNTQKGEPVGKKLGICFKCFAKAIFLLSAVCVFAFWGQQTNGKNNAKKGRDKERKREFPKLIKTS